MPEEAEQIAYAYEIRLGVILSRGELFMKCREWHDKCQKAITAGCAVEFCACDHIIRINDDLFKLQVGGPVQRGGTEDGPALCDRPSQGIARKVFRYLLSLPARHRRRQPELRED